MSPTFRKGDNAATLNAKNAKLIHALSGQIPTTPSKVTWITDPSDSLTLRGIPAIGRGVAGAIPGTRPDSRLDD